MSGTVTALALTPVKGTRLQSVRRIQLERSGGPANRRFYVIDDRSRMVNGKMLGGLQLIVADYSDEECTLALRFPDGQVVEGEVQSGASVTTKFFSHSAEGRLVIGPWSAALSLSRYWERSIMGCRF